MRFFTRLVPLIASLIIFILLELVLKTPHYIYWMIFLLPLVVVLSIWQLTGRSFKNEKFRQFVITPSLLVVSGLFFLSFLGGSFFRQFFIVVLAVLIWLFLEVIFLRFHFRPKYQPYSLENISVHLNLFIIFLIASSLFSLVIFLGIPLWSLIIIFAFISALLTYQLVWVCGVNLTIGAPYIIIITLVAAEIFWTVSFLPTSVYVSGLVVTIIYYLMTGLVRNWLLEIRDKKVIVRYFVISIVCLIVILVTAKWF